MQELEGKITLTTQFNTEQLNLLLQIMIAQNLKPSKAEVLRNAFDFYVQKKYPHLLTEKEVQS